MRLHVKPIYGWGWVTTGENQTRDVPEPFDMDTAPPSKGNFFALGQVETSSHPFSHHWIELSQRHTTWDGFCNVSVFEERPENVAVKPIITGFAEVVIS